MSKEDRYAHLGDGADEKPPAEGPADADADMGADAETDADIDADADAETDPDERPPRIRVTIDDGDEEITLTVDPAAASAEELRDAVTRASEDASPAPLAAGVRSMLVAQRLALEASLTGAAVATDRTASVLFPSG